MLLGTFNSLRAQQQLINSYELELKTLPKSDFVNYFYQRHLEIYNYNLTQFPNNIVAKICGFTTKKPSS
jgi:hypothetical protein